MHGLMSIYGVSSDGLDRNGIAQPGSCDGRRSGEEELRSLEGLDVKCWFEWRRKTKARWGRVQISHSII